MKKLALMFAALIIFGVLFLTPRPAGAATFHSFFYQSECSKPIGYRVGNIDPQFKVSENEFKTDIAKATDIWEKSYNKDLFVYDPNAPLKINLTYDIRQQSFDQTKNISDQVKNLGSEIKNLGTELTKDKKNLEPEIQEYQQRVQNFNNRIQKLNSDIQYWNSQGGAPEAEFQRLNEEKESLQNEAASLDLRSKQLEDLRQSINTQVGQYNNQISQLNQKTGQLNQSIQILQKTIDEKPEEGLYNPKTQTINVYFNVDDPELIETLAHELGHARGLGHNENKQSIMYGFSNKEIALTLAPEDLRDLDQICKERSLLEIAYTKFQNAIFYYTQKIQGYF